MTGNHVNIQEGFKGLYVPLSPVSKSTPQAIKYCQKLKTNSKGCETNYNMFLDKSKKETILLMSKEPVIARNLHWRKLTNGSWEADYGPDYREGEEPAAPLPKKFPPHSNIVFSLIFGSVHGFPDYEPDLAVGQREVQGVNDLLQA